MLSFNDLKYASAIKANFIVYDLPFHICYHPKIKYFTKLLKISRPLAITHHNIVDIPMLRRMSDFALTFSGGVILKTVILAGFFTFLHLSNLCPHSLASFDPSRHLMGADVLFTKQHVKLVIKWSKTMQTRDSAQILTLPHLVDKKLCPRSALKALQGLAGWVPLTDSRVRKTLEWINLALGLNPSYFTFHSFRRSAATPAFNSHVPIQSIKRHSTWTSDCVWRYIQADQSSGEQLACYLFIFLRRVQQPGSYCNG